MSKRTIFNVVACFSGGVLVILFLQLFAVGPNQTKNHFIRIFPSHFILAPKILALNHSDYYIAGLTTKFIYLGNYTDPSIISKVDWNLLSYHSYTLPVPFQEISIPAALHVSIDSPFLYLNNYATGFVFRGNINNPEGIFTQVYSKKISTSIFIPYDYGSFAVRTVDRARKENVLGKLSTDSPHIKLWPNIIGEQSEELFVNDGLLRFDPVSGHFVYLYFYRNQFICLDSNFNIAYRGQTIDTNSHAKIRVVTNVSQDVSTIASPGYRVNRTGCIDHNWIFINSDLRADNEELNIFDHYAVIDVYGLTDGHYHFSFYLSKTIGKITDLAILQNNLVVIQDRRISVYPLNMKEVKNLWSPGPQ